MSGSNSAERKRHEPLVLVETADLSEEDWLDYRRRGIGGSDVSAIFGTSPFRTARDLYYDKLNIASVEDDEGNWVAMEMGHLLEPLVAKIFERKTGYRVYQIKKMFQHPQYPWMLADVDYFVELPDGTTAILEIKTTNYNARDNWWMNGKETVPVYYECRGYQFVMGLNTTEKANCRENGFHCAENPLDCLSYYSSLEHSEYYIVNAGGDIDEDEHDSKIACTELTVIKRLTKEELFLHGLAYMVDHPRRVWSSHVAANRAMANCGYAVVRGKDPVATGRLGDILAFAKEAPDSESIVQVAVGQIDGVTLLPDVWYGVDLTRRTVN